MTEFNIGDVVRYEWEMKTILRVVCAKMYLNKKPYYKTIIAYGPPARYIGKVETVWHDGDRYYKVNKNA